MRSVAKPTLQNFRSKGANAKLLVGYGHAGGPRNIMGSQDCGLIQTGRGRKRLICGEQLAKIIAEKRVKRSSDFQMFFQ